MARRRSVFCTASRAMVVVFDEGSTVRCSPYDFATATDLPGRDSMLVQSSVRFTHPSNFFVQMDLGGEFFRTDYTAVNVGLQLGWDF